MTSKILVTGADGFLGCHLIAELLKKGYRVRAFVVPKAASLVAGIPGVEVVTGDIRNPQDCAKAVQGVQKIIHAAATTQTWPERNPVVHEINYKGTLNLLAAAQNAHVERFVHIGSANSFQPGSKNHPGNEEGAFFGDTFGLDYIDSKYLAQKTVLTLAREQGFPALAVCPTFMIGPNDRYGGTSRLVRAFMYRTLPFTTQGGKCFVYVGDVAVAAVHALTLGNPGEAYIAGGENLTFTEFARKVAAINGVAPPKLVLPSAVVTAYGWVLGKLGALLGFTPSLSYATARISTDNQYFSSEKAKKYLAMPQTPIDEAIRRASAWIRQNDSPGGKTDVVSGAEMPKGSKKVAATGRSQRKRSSKSEIQTSSGNKH